MKTKAIQKIKYFELIKELALTDFKLKYQGSVLGYLWSLAKPFMFFLVLYFVFTNIFRVGGAIPNYPTYLFSGIVLWSFFAEVTATSLDAIVGKGDLIRKVYFPRIVLVLSRNITSLLTFSLNLLVVFAFMFFTGVELHLRALLFPLVVIELFILAVGIALILSSLYVRFRDLSHIWEVILQAAFYATPILYPLTLVPDLARKILVLSPMAQIIQDARYFLITDQTIRASDVLVAKHLWVPYVSPFIILGFGYWLFQRSAAKFAEEI